jgi:predicted CXXCH cytochrome family protein
MNRKEIALAIGIFAALAAILALVYIGTTTTADGVAGTRGETDNSYMDTATFLGSSGCTGCHPTNGADWAGSLHTKMLQDPSPATVLPPSWSGAVNLTDAGLWGNVTLYEDTGTYYVDLGGGYNYTVWKTMGSAWKQRYVTEIGNSKYILPLQWNTDTSEWVSYHLSDWFDVPDIPKDIAKSQSWDRRCAGCHSTGTTIAFNGTSGEWVASYSELNVGCEACHGPGSDHNGNPDFIWRSADSQICGQCHNRGSGLEQVGGSTTGWPWAADGKYYPGDDLSLYFDPVDPVNDTSRFWPNGMSKSHRQQYIDWAGTAHADALTPIATLPFAQDYCLECHSTDYWLAEEHGDPLPNRTAALWSIECVRCHTPHGTTANDAMLWKPENETCEQCHNTHGDAPPDEPHHPNEELIRGYIVISGQSGDPWMQGAVTCADCHMVEVAKSAITGDIPSHTFGFAHPQETIDNGMPNGCTSFCHDGVNGAVLTDQEAVDYVHDWETNYTSRITAVESVIDDAKQALADALDLGFSQAEFDDANTSYHNALFAYQYVESDASDGAHNHPFQMDLLDYAETTAQGVIDDLTPGTISGIIHDKDGNPLEDAEIRSDGNVWDTTNAQGEFSFEHAPGAATFDVYYEDEDVGDVTGTIPTDVGIVEVDVGGEEAPLDMMWIYLAIAVIIIIIIIIAVVAVSRRGGAPPEDFEEEEPPTTE